MSDAISNYMRAMQRKSAASRWSGKSAEERSEEMRRLRAKAKKRRKTRKPNKVLTGTEPAAGDGYGGANGSGSFDHKGE